MSKGDDVDHDVHDGAGHVLYGDVLCGGIVAFSQE